MQIAKIEEVYKVTFDDGSVQYIDKVTPPVDVPDDKPDPDNPPGDDDDEPLWQWAVASKELDVYEAVDFDSKIIYRAVKDTVFEVKFTPITSDKGGTWQWRETRSGHFIQELNIITDNRVLSIGLPGDGDDDFPDEPPPDEDDLDWYTVTSSYVNTRLSPNTSGAAIRLEGGRDAFIKLVPTTALGYDANWVWGQIQMTNGDTAKYKDRYVAIKSADGKTVFLSNKDEPDPKS